MFNAGTLEVMLRLKDSNFSSGLNGAVASLDKAGTKMTEVGDKMSSAGKSLLPLTAAIGGVGFAALKAFGDFDDAMVGSLAIMGDVSDMMKGEMSDAAREVAKTTVFSAEQAAESFFFLASAGLDAEASIAALPKVAAFAQAGAFDMARATDLLTDAQSALGLAIKDDAVANMHEMVKVSDVLVKANTLANASVEQFSTALTNKAGAALRIVNKDMEEGVAVLAAYADRGVKGAEAGEKLNILLRDIPRSLAKNTAGYEELGLVVTDSTGNLLNMADIIENMGEKFGDMSDAELAATLDTLKLTRGVGDAIKGLMGAEDAIREYEAALRSAGGMTDQVASKQMDSFKKQLSLVWSQLVDVAITIGEEIAPALLSMASFVSESVIPALEGWAESFSELDPLTKNVTIAVVGLTAALGPLLIAVGSVVKFAGLLIGASGIGGLMTGITMLGNTVPVLTARIWLLSAGISGTVAAATLGIPIVAKLGWEIGELINKKLIGVHAWADYVEWVGLGEKHIGLTAEELAHMRGEVEQVTEATRDNTEAVREVVPIFRSAAEVASEFRKSGAELTGALEDLGIVTGDQVLKQLNDFNIVLDNGAAPAKGLAANVATLIEQWEELDLLSPEIRSAIDLVTGKLREQGAIVEQLIGTESEGFKGTTNAMDAFGEGAGKLPPVLSDIGGEIDIMRQMFGLTEEQIGAILATTGDFNDMMQLASGIAGDWGTEIQKTALEMVGLAGGTDEAKESLEGFLDELFGGIPVLGDLLGGLSDVITGLLSKVTGDDGFFGKLANGFTSLFGGGSGGGGSFFGDVGADAFKIGAEGLGEATTTGFLSTLKGVFGSVSSFMPIVGPLLAAFGGPLLKGIKALAGKVWNGIKSMFGGPSGAELEARKVVGAMDDMFTSILDQQQLVEAGHEQWKQNNVAQRDMILATGGTLEDVERIWIQFQNRAKDPASAKAFEEFWTAKLAEVQDRMNETGLTLTELRNQVMNDAQDLAGAMADAGDAAAQTIEDTAGAAADAARDFADGAMDDARRVGDTYIDEWERIRDAVPDFPSGGGGGGGHHGDGGSDDMGLTMPGFDPGDDTFAGGFPPHDPSGGGGGRRDQGKDRRDIDERILRELKRIHAEIEDLPRAAKHFATTAARRK